MHDPTRQSPCPKYLLGQVCEDSCKLNHAPTPFVIPNCAFHEKGTCTRNSCKFLHIKHKADAHICYSFSETGYCSKGSLCPDIHMFICPRFERDGKCTKKGCKLRHKANLSLVDNIPIIPDFSEPVLDSSDDLSSDTSDGDSDDGSEEESDGEESSSEQLDQ